MYTQFINGNIQQSDQLEPRENGVWASGDSLRQEKCQIPHQF